ncbi:MAG: alpha-amylase family protein [bacterium]
MLLFLIILPGIFSQAPLLLAMNQTTGSFQRVPAIPIRPEYKQFRILIWQYGTSVMKDLDLYRKAGFCGFHIDRGSGKEKLAQFSLENRLPYYVDHVGDKGFLYLTGNRIASVTDKHGLATRPHSLADPKTIAQIKQHITKNIMATKEGYVLAYAFDDEISLGRMVTPCDVDIHPESIAWFRKWLQNRYGNVDRLNNQWGTSFGSFSEVLPQGFEEVRKKLPVKHLSRWNLSPWMDFRSFMDFQFASVLADLTHHANTLDPNTPAGFVGGQAPGPWGGYDYALLSRAVQWMEAYNIHGTNEILRSFWNNDRRLRMQTFFSTQNPKLDSWFLWYYLLHGNQAVIAWPEGWFRGEGYDIAPYILANKNTFQEIQGEISEPLLSSETVFEADPIGIYYSHPSIQAGWAMDAIVHGGTWFNRKDSIDNVNQSSGILRQVWCKLLEDMGYQYDFISYLDVREGVIDLLSKFKVIILPKTICLSGIEVNALRKFVAAGGILVADNLCGVLDEHGKGQKQGVLDDLFGIRRRESAGYMNGKGITEINAEKYRQPFLKRLSYYDGASRYKEIVVFELGIGHGPQAQGIEVKDTRSLFHWLDQNTSVLIRNRADKGYAVYLNLSPIEYWDTGKRFSRYGDTWREIMSGIMKMAGLKPRVKVFEQGNAANMIECLSWKNGSRHYLGLVKNPAEQKGPQRVSEKSTIQDITGKEVKIRLEFREPVQKLINLRSRKVLGGGGRVFSDDFRPWEGNFYEVVF